MSWEDKEQIQKGAEQDEVAQSEGTGGEMVQTLDTQLASIIAYTERESGVLEATSVPSAVIIILCIANPTGFVLMDL